MNHGNGRIKVKCDLRIKNWTELKKKIKVWNTLIISELHHHYSFCCDNNCKYLVWNDYSMLLNWSSQPYNTSAFHSAGRPFFDGLIFAFFWVFLRVVLYRVGKGTCSTGFLSYKITNRTISYFYTILALFVLNFVQLGSHLSW